MKKLTLICTALFTLGILNTGKNSANAQKLTFGLNVGYSMPSGDFSSTDASKQPIVAYPSTDTSHIAGYATGGFHFNLYATYMFTGQVGAMLSIGGSMNGYNVATLNTNYATAYGGGSGNLPAFTTSGNYYIGQYLVGPYVCIPAGSKLKIEFKGLVGLTTANYPSLSYSYSILGVTESETYAVKSASGFGYNVGAGLEYMLTDMLGLHFNVCYGGTSVSYPGYTATETQGSNSSSQTRTTAMAMSLGMIQLTVGASVSL